MQCPHAPSLNPSPNLARERRKKPLHAPERRIGGSQTTGPRPMPASHASKGEFDPARVDRFVSEKWDQDIVPQLVEYIRIPNKSPMFDTDWVKNGHMDAAVKLMETWAKAQPIPGLVVEVVQLEGRTPLISQIGRASCRERVCQYV